MEKKGEQYKTNVEGKEANMEVESQVEEMTEVDIKKMYKKFEEESLEEMWDDT